MTKLEDVYIKIRFVELLRLLKEQYTYQELSSMLGLPITVINRYLKGRVLPRTPRCLELIQKIERMIRLEDLVRRKMKINENGFVDITEVLKDVVLLRYIAMKVFEIFREEKITLVLTAATDGIPLATLIAQQFKVPLAYAKDRKEVGVEKFLEVSYMPGSTGMILSLYLPHNMIRKGDNVLIADDFIRTGETQRALYHLALKAKANPIGMYVIVAKKDAKKELEGELGIPIYSLIEFRRT